jgi:small-conductance mechanosensitive channel
MEQQSQFLTERLLLFIKEHLKYPGKHLVSTDNNSLGTIVKIDDEAVFVITEDDADKSQQLAPQDVVKISMSSLNEVILESRQSRDVEYMTRAFIKVSIATFVFFVLLWLLAHAKQALEGWVVKHAQAKKLSMGGAEELLRKPAIWLIRHAVLALYWFLIFLMTYKWLSLILAQFPHSRAWGEQLNGYLLSVAAKFGSAILKAIPDLFSAFFIFVLARLVVQGIKGFFEGVEVGTIKVSWMESDVASTSQRIASTVVWLFALAMAYPYLPGSGTDAFKGISVLVGLMMSLGASSLVSQAGSGLILTYTRMFRRGEYVGIGEHEGTVVELGMFTTRIRTGLGEELALPNSLILGNVTKNYSRVVQGPGFIVDVTVTIGYDTPWRQVHAMLIEAATRTSGVLAEPAPRVFQVALADFYPEYRLVCQAIPSEPRPRAEVINALNGNIQDVFNEYGVQIMSPHYFADPAEAKVVAVDKWFMAPAKPPLK